MFMAWYLINWLNTETILPSLLRLDTKGITFRWTAISFRFMKRTPQSNTVAVSCNIHHHFIRNIIFWVVRPDEKLKKKFSKFFARLGSYFVTAVFVIVKVLLRVFMSFTILNKF
jgi:hypothetical protein